MKILILILLLSGCSTFQTKQANNITDNTNHTGINPYSINEYPIPQQNQTKCLQGTIDEIITGNEATTIWYQTANSMGLMSTRLPHTFPLKIKIVNGAFCYDYFDVTFKVTQ